MTPAHPLPFTPSWMHVLTHCWSESLTLGPHNHKKIISDYSPVYKPVWQMHLRCVPRMLIMNSLRVYLPRYCLCRLANAGDYICRVLHNNRSLNTDVVLVYLEWHSAELTCWPLLNRGYEHWLFGTRWSSETILWQRSSINLRNGLVAGLLIVVALGVAIGVAIGLVMLVSVLVYMKR